MKITDIYILLRQASIKNVQDTYIYNLLKQTKLDYRTIKALIKIIDQEPDLSQTCIETLLSEDFYTLKNMKLLVREGFTDIIPHYFYLDENFLNETGITEIPSRFLENSLFIKEIVIPDQIESLGSYAFKNCYKMEYIKLPKNLKRIEKGCFENCESLKMPRLPESLYFIGNSSFKNNKSIVEIELPEKILEIHGEAFKNCSKLQKIDAQNRIIKANNRCFENCINLKEANITFSKLGDECFKRCKNIISLQLKNTKFGNNVFEKCENLKTLYLDGCNSVECGTNLFKGIDPPDIISKDFIYQIKNIDNFVELTRPITTIEDDKGYLKIKQKIKTNKNIEEIIQKIKGEQ